VALLKKGAKVRYLKSEVKCLFNLSCIYAENGLL